MLENFQKEIAIAIEKLQQLNFYKLNYKYEKT